ncbi:tetratricopeptide repeat protein [Kribbella sp. NPDC056951]|uniref:AfsR/SARP family transcriptional regulator n=1 Tax=Kribbella sp. NPDC056951 TaxID=3345978 RepID=UPI00363C71CA
MVIDVRLFGAVRVVVDGVPAELRGWRLRTVVAVLALSAGEQVSVEALAERVWGAELPERVPQSVHTLIARLRSAVGADVVRTAAGGYVLAVPAEQVDVLRFERLLRDGDDAGALRVWTGQPFVDARSEWLTSTVVPRLEELRLAAVERRADAVEPSSGLLAELRELAAQHPLRESLWIRLLRGLARSGRSAEALGLYDVVRARIADELGVGVGAELQALHAELLGSDAKLHGSGEIEPGTPRSLPVEVPGFVGREDELAALTGAGALAAIDGMAGVGKTALAVHVAHRLAARYPDGQVFIDLHGHTDGVAAVPAGEVLGRLLQAFGVPLERTPENVDDRAGLLRSVLAGRRVLIVLDNASGEDQVRPLLPGTAGCGVLVTSRHRLSGLDLDVTVSLDTLSQSDAVELFTRVVGRDRVATTAPGVLAEVVEQCGRLPLAIRISAARLRTHASWRPEDLLERLQEHRLSELASGPRSVAAAIGLSYRELDAPLRRAYRLLGLHPGGDFGTASAAALLDSPDAGRCLERLLEVHLLNEPSPGRYQFHDLVREHAIRVGSEDKDRRTALARLVAYYCQGASEAAAQIYPQVAEVSHGLAPIIDTAEAAQSWLKAELPTLLQLPTEAECTVHLSGSLYLYLRTLGRSTALEDLHRRALAVTNDSETRTDLLLRLGECLRLQGSYTAATAAFEEALAGAGDYSQGEVQARRGLGIVLALRDRNDAALTELEIALRLAWASADRDCQLDVLNAIGWIHTKRGDTTAALDYTQQALAIAQSVGHRMVGKLLAGIAHDHLQMGKPRVALEFYEEALEHARAHGNRHNELRSVDGLAEVHRQLGDLTRAMTYREQAMALATDLGSRNWQLEAHQGLGRLRLALGDAEAAVVAHERALELATALYQPVDQARAHDGRADAYAVLGRYHEARHGWQHALAILQAVGVETTDETETGVLALQAKLGYVIEEASNQAL